MISDYDICPNNFASSYALETDFVSSFAEGQAYEPDVFLIEPGVFADTDWGHGTALYWIPRGDFATGQRDLKPRDAILIF